MVRKQDFADTAIFSKKEKPFNTEEELPVIQMSEMQADGAGA